MLPNFLIIGAAKAASTWLSDCLGEHPDVFMAEVKEVDFFTKHFEKGLEWYESHFSDWSGQAVIGEATPGYIGHPETPGRIQAILGNVKMIASLRHPIDRAYSSFWHYLSRGRIPVDADFATYFRQGRFRLLRAGYYFAHLSHHLEYFPFENYLILIYEEDVAKDPKEGVRKCFEFLDVDSSFVPDAATERSNRAREISVFHDQGWALRRAMDSLPEGLRKPLAAVGKRAFELSPKKQAGYVPLAEDLRQELLNEYYMSDIRQLESLLDRDLSIWYE